VTIQTNYAKFNNCATNVEKGTAAGYMLSAKFNGTKIIKELKVTTQPKKPQYGTEC